VSGIQEILVIVLLIVALLVVPRMFGNRHRSSAPKPPRPPLSGPIRLAIIASIAWPLAMAALLQPWHHQWLIFSGLGLAPVLTGWSVAWVLHGYRRR